MRFCGLLLLGEAGSACNQNQTRKYGNGSSHQFKTKRSEVLP
jgi:hypothetical protein